MAEYGFAGSFNKYIESVKKRGDSGIRGAGVLPTHGKWSEATLNVGETKSEKARKGYNLVTQSQSQFFI